MSVKLGKPAAGEVVEGSASESPAPAAETEARGPEPAPSQQADQSSNPLFHFHGSERNFGHQHPSGNVPHTGHDSTGKPIFELPGSEEAPEDGCPSKAHLHVTANRRFGFPRNFMDIGHQIVTGKDPWNFSSHCPECGTLVRDRNSRRFRCTAEGCDGRWEVSQQEVQSARSAAKNSPLGVDSILRIVRGDQ